MQRASDHLYYMFDEDKQIKKDDNDSEPGYKVELHFSLSLGFQKLQTAPEIILISQ